MASSSAVKPTVGILSIGSMGMGIAKLLIAHGYTVYTVGAGRSQSTIDRIESAKIHSLPSDESLVVESDIVFSIVPPRDAIATARRISDACHHDAAIQKRSKRRGTEATNQAPSLTLIDMNAVSPKTTRMIHALLNATRSPSTLRRISSSFNINKTPEPTPIHVNLFDGGIIGPPPSQQEDQSWKKPSVVLSGPDLDHWLPSDLLEILNGKVISDKIGSASALKACFASLSKGLTALSILSYTTAMTCSVLPELQEHLKEFSPHTYALVEKSLTGMPPKAYRWVDEMHQIGETFAEEGGFSSGLGGKAAYDAIADVYKFVAEETELGLEKPEKRKRGTTAEDVAECVSASILAKRRKETGDERLELAWRSSWT